MSIVRRIRWRILLMYITSVLFSIAGVLISVWYFIGTVYILLHLVAPLDWILIYNAYEWLKERR